MGIFDNFSSSKDGVNHPNHHIKGVVCDVHNCTHHDGDCYCTADKIAVGPSFATACSDTVCATFKPKNQNF